MWRDKNEYNFNLRINLTTFCMVYLKIKSIALWTPFAMLGESGQT